jgi:hypothetical protein
MSDEQPRDEQGRFISGLFSAQQARAASTRRISEGLQKIAADMQAAKDKQGQRLTPEQEQLARAEFL